MGDLEELEHKIQNLPIEELSKFRAWFIEFDHLLWDQQIEADSKVGKLHGLVSEARADYQAGKTREIRTSQIGFPASLSPFQEDR